MNTQKTSSQNMPLCLQTLPTDCVGVGFKPLYFDEIMAEKHNIGWFEVHAENYMIDGGPIRQQLVQIRSNYPVSCHGVGLSIGSMEPLDSAHLERLKTLIDWLQPAMFSEHLAWSSHGLNHFNDLLPLPYTQDTLKQVSLHINQVQDSLNCQMLLENPSLYVDFDCHEMSEIEFIREVICRTGCGLLLDINNVYVSAINQNTSATAYLEDIPFDAVGEIHLAGHATDQNETNEPLLIDSHNTTVSDPVWQLYQQVVDRHGPTPTLIEWDNDLPDFRTLESEANKATAYLKTHLESHPPHKVKIA